MNKTEIQIIVVRNEYDANTDKTLHIKEASAVLKLDSELSENDLILSLCELAKEPIQKIVEVDIQKAWESVKEQ